jgi:hypothetical protein
MRDERNLKRTRVVRSAKIITAHYAHMIDCTILDLTNRGAAVDIAGAFVLPDSFLLTLDRGRTLRTCRVIWRRNERLGVAFEQN